MPQDLCSATEDNHGKSMSIYSPITENRIRNIINKWINFHFSKKKTLNYIVKYLHKSDWCTSICQLYVSLDAESCKNPSTLNNLVYYCIRPVFLPYWRHLRVEISPDMWCDTGPHFRLLVHQCPRSFERFELRPDTISLPAQRIQPNMSYCLRGSLYFFLFLLLKQNTRNIYINKHKYVWTATKLWKHCSFKAFILRTEQLQHYEWMIRRQVVHSNNIVCTLGAEGMRRILLRCTICIYPFNPSVWYPLLLKIGILFTY